jgi:sterol desaturase/sphingolipid hydroxylase (fatty acid hydroxylase superfamily)
VTALALLVAAAALFVLAGVCEAIVSVSADRPYPPADVAANVVIYAVYALVLGLFWTPVTGVLYEWAHSHALLDLTVEGPLGRWSAAAPWLLLVVLEDLCFYAFHRASHRCRLLWAAHQVHHSSQAYNLSVALRQSWIVFVATPFWLPLPLLGFAPAAVLTVQTASLLFQGFLHTEWVGSYGLLDAIFNSPKHHRAHHGHSPELFDKNFAGVFILWDRVFRTWVGQTAATYGIGTAAGHNPFVIELGPWMSLARGVSRARSPWAALRYLFGPPGEGESEAVHGSALP